MSVLPASPGSSGLPGSAGFSGPSGVSGSSGSAGGPAGGRSGGFLGDVLRSEWAKFRSIRSIVYVLAGAFLVTGCYAFLFGTANGRAYAAGPAAERASFDPFDSAFRGLMLVQLLVSAAGALVVTSEYAAGTMRTSVVVVPWRRRLVVGKAVLMALVMLGCGPLIVLVSVLVSQAALAGQGAPSLAPTDPGVPWMIVGGGLYMTAIGLYGVAMGFLLRRTAGAVSLGSFLLLFPAMAPLFPEGMARWTVTYWPTSAGGRVLALDPPITGALSPAAGFGVLAGTVLVLLVAASALFRARDV